MSRASEADDRADFAVLRNLSFRVCKTSDQHDVVLATKLLTHEIYFQSKDNFLNLQKYEEKHRKKLLLKVHLLRLNLELGLE